MNRIYFTLWAIGALTSAAAHLLAPVFMANGVSWPLAHGWQREIALFDIALGTFILSEMRLRGADNLSGLMALTVLLSLCLGVNHLLSGLNGGWGYIHVAGTTANALAVVVGATLILKNLRPDVVRQSL